ncbi:sulfatase [Benzoatithermus flavus]|uniref:Sulfatase n=1 Tax=Benzoatithermus flavus TaxID=3108223 RepID=A0ABU8XLH6_9PROT
MLHPGRPIPLTLLWLLAAIAPAAATATEPAASFFRPNIVLILSDDEDLASHAYMPKTRALVEEQGVSFGNFFVSYSFCCPSRATILRGQYPHNHRIEGNEWPTGGFEKFRALGHESSTIATWLHAAGYRTALLGKYLNGYLPERHEPAPGWDEWFVTGGTFSNYNYTINHNGELIRHGNAPEDYLTDVLGTEAVGIIERAAAHEQPLFMIVAPYNPHSPATPAPRHEGLFADVAMPKPPSFDEPDVGDKPAAIRKTPRLAEWQKKAIEEHYRDRLRSLQSVDDTVERIVKALEATGQIGRTYLVYSSDNGFHMGQHRLFVGKTTAYEEDIRAPLIVRGPGVPAGEKRDQLVLNNDLAPTFAAMAGVEPPGFVDGRSFLPLLHDGKLPWRRSFLIERREMETHEITGPAIFDAIRTADSILIRYGTGETEYYDLNRDPFELVNRIDQVDPALLNSLTRRLAELTSCASYNCQELEDQRIEPMWSPSAQK